jgi:hypothetical protein
MTAPTPPSPKTTPAPVPIAERRDDFLRLLKKIELPPVGHADRRNALRRFQRFCRAHVQALKDAGYTINTVKTALTDYRNAVKDVLNGDELKFTLRYFTLTREEWWSLRREYEKKVTAEVGKTRPIQAGPILQMAKSNLHADSYTRQTAALMLVTGRRSIEVLKLGSVTPVPGRDDVVMFAGQAKTREVGVPPYEIPVLASAAEVIGAWNALRAKLTIPNPRSPGQRPISELTPDEINARCAKSLNETVESMFGKSADDQKLKPKDLRAVYALICRETRKPVDMSVTVYLATILGHRIYDDQDVNAARPEGMLNRSIADSYEDFHLIPEGPSAKTAADLGAKPNPYDEDDIPDEMVGDAPVDEDVDPDAKKNARV